MSSVLRNTLSSQNFLQKQQQQQQQQEYILTMSIVNLQLHIRFKYDNSEYMSLPATQPILKIVKIKQPHSEWNTVLKEHTFSLFL